MSCGVPTRPSSDPRRALLELLRAPRAAPRLRRVDEPRHDDVAANTLRRVLAARRHRQLDDARLAHAVGHRRGRRPRPRARRHVHDGAPARQHGGDGVLGAEEHAPQVGVHRQVPLQLRDVHERRRSDHHPGVVHQHVQPPEALDGLFDHRADLRRLRNVDFDEERIGARVAHQRHRPIGLRCVAVRHHDLRPLAGEEQRRRPADARGPARDDRYLVLQTACHRSSLLLPLPPGEGWGEGPLRRSCLRRNLAPASHSAQALTVAAGAPQVYQPRRSPGEGAPARSMVQ